jgi:hypothetical protein
MEEPNDLARAWIRSRDVRTLVPITVKASQREILKNGPTPMLSRDNMIDVKRQG